MICELDRAQFERVWPLFEGWAFNIRVNAVINGYGTGRIYVDDVKRPRTAVVWGKDLFYLGGAEDNSDFNAALDGWITETIAPQAVKVGLDYFAVQVYPLERWKYKIQALLQHRHPGTNHEWKHTFNAGKYCHIQGRRALPPGFSIHRVDKELLADPQCEVVLKEIEQSCVSVDGFLEQGVGFCLRHAGQVITSCISVYVSGQKHEIGIWTYDPAYRNRGFATLTAKATIDHCLAHGLTPVWTADEGNAPSLVLAKKLGFEKVAEYPDYWFLFQSEQ